MDALRARLQSKKKELSDLKADSMQTDAGFEQSIATHRAAESALTSEMRNKREQREQHLRKFKDLQKEMSRMETAMTKLTSIQSEIRTAEEELKAFAMRTTPFGFD